MKRASEVLETRTGHEAHEAPPDFEPAEGESDELTETRRIHRAMIARCERIETRLGELDRTLDSIGEALRALRSKGSP